MAVPTDAVQTARALAATNPEGKLPCPICANSLDAKNLEKHLAKVHAGARAATGPWRGVDHKVLIACIALFVVGVIATIALIANDVVKPGSPPAFAVIAILVLPAGVATATLFGATKGSVYFDGNDLVLSHTLGLRRVRVRLAGMTIESGPFFVTRGGSVMTNSDYNAPAGREVREGSYLHVANGGAKFTIAMKGDTMFRETWDASGFTAGKKRSWYDIKVPRDAMVAIEYELAGRGLLSPAARAA